MSDPGLPPPGYPSPQHPYQPYPPSSQYDQVSNYGQVPPVAAAQVANQAWAGPDAAPTAPEPDRDGKVFGLRGWLAVFTWGLLLAVAGGAIWGSLSPTGEAVWSKSGLQMVSGHEVFAWQSAIFGVVSIVLAVVHGWVCHRAMPRRTVLALVASLVAGALCAVVVWLVGEWVGPSVTAPADLSTPVKVPGPVRLVALPMLGLWPLVLAAVSAFGLRRWPLSRPAPLPIGPGSTPPGLAVQPPPVYPAYPHSPESFPGHGQPRQ